VDTAGHVLGEHKGAIHYTVGQRRGLGVAAEEPFYVIRVEAEHNRVVVGREHELEQPAIAVRDLNWVSCDPPEEPLEMEVKVRYRSRPAKATIHANGDTACVSFQEPHRAAAPGQSAVFYAGDIVLGGGVIDSLSVATWRK
jgi:tRNA-specific 2-thiouridylase